MKKEKPCVYIIKCPDTLNVVYVGQTLCFKTRVTCHLTSTTLNSPIARFITHLKNQGKSPIIEIERYVYEKNRYNAEAETITKYKQNGTLLLNSHQNISIRKAVKFYLPHEFETDTSLNLRIA